MKISLVWRKAVCWTVLTGCIAGLAPRSLGKVEPTKDPADKEACQGQLNLIFEAIQEYRKQHENRLPDKLSDLTPEFIQNPKILICPYVHKTGGLRAWREEIRELGRDPRTSYGYEFAPEEIGDDLWRGLPKRSWREFKERLMEKVGPVVPIVRCHVHEPRLNLAFDGHIYESGLYWEENYAPLATDEDMHSLRFFSDRAAVRKVAGTDFPPRDPGAPPRVLDLSAHYNGLLTDSWQGYPSNHLARLPSGLRELGGVPFDVRGLIQLQGEKLPIRFPDKVQGIRVNQKLSRIHFLHGTSHAAGSRTNIASYVIHYSDGQTREIPIYYGKQIADWWVDPKNPSEPTDAKVAWTGQNEAAKAYGGVLRLYQFAWENPRKEVEVVSISFVSRLTLSAPFLIAVTADP